MKLPRARQENLIVRELLDEVLVYDLRRDKAHCLNRTTALVWKHCDGETTMLEMIELLQNELQTRVEDDVVWLAIEQLQRHHLLAESAPEPGEVVWLSRRVVMQNISIASLPS